mmetsp:Transcript_51679/g.121326  ORF Transcript_51679/g.121326 Transcript_51679/m.121326 type:complete len:299 (-) Transcript_51679:649-1545(-)
MLVGRLVRAFVRRDGLAEEAVVRKLERHLEAPVQAQALGLDVLGREPCVLEDLCPHRVDCLVEAHSGLLDGVLAGSVMLEHQPLGSRLRRELCGDRSLLAVVVDLVEVAEHCDAVAPGVLKVDGRAPRGQHDQLEALVEPAVAARAVEHKFLLLFEACHRGVLEADGEEGGVDHLQRGFVLRVRLKFLARVGPAVAVRGGQDAHRQAAWIVGRVHDVAEAAHDLASRHHRPVVPQDVNLPELVSALHDHVVALGRDLELVLDPLRDARGVEEVFVLRHVEGEGAVEVCRVEGVRFGRH